MCHWATELGWFQMKMSDHGGDFMLWLAVQLWILLESHEWSRRLKSDGIKWTISIIIPWSRENKSCFLVINHIVILRNCLLFSRDNKINPLSRDNGIKIIASVAVLSFLPRFLKKWKRLRHNHSPVWNASYDEDVRDWDASNNVFAPGVYVGSVSGAVHCHATPHTLHEHWRRLRLLRHALCHVEAHVYG